MTTARLAEEQLERDRLRAEDAQAAYERAEAGTVLAPDLRAASRHALGPFARLLADLPAALLDATEGERTVERLHQRLTETVFDSLRETGAALVQATRASHIPALGHHLARGLKPRDLLGVAQWAERHRHLDTGTNAPGPWRNERTPYLVEIMDALSEHSPVRSVTFMKSSGVGGSEAMWNWLGYVMHHLGNKDLLLIVPSIEVRDRTFNPRLRKMLAETAVLNDLVSSKQRDKRNSAEVLEYNGGARVIKSGANSPDSMRSEHLPYVICDEVDAYPWDVGGEGDPMKLIANRQRAFSGRAKSYFISTPTVEGASRIDQLYRASDQRRYHIHCPDCGHIHTLDFDNLRWRTDHPEVTEVIDEATLGAQVQEAWLLCPECGVRIPETHKTDLLQGGRWIAARPHIKRNRGYHINALYSPVGLGVTWADIAQDWIEAQGDTSKLKAFYNTHLGLVYTEPGDDIADLPLYNRREPYLHTLAALPILAITAGVDVQKDRIEASIVAWGVEEECWLLEHLIFPGNPEEPDVWADLEEGLKTWSVDLAALDTGYLTSMVTDFVQPRAWCRAIKGNAGMDRPLVEDERKRKQRLRYRRRKGAPIEPIGVDQAKTLIYQRVRLPKPGPRYIHFPISESFDEEYFAQLAAERMVAREKGYRLRYEWVQLRPRNETLDALVYALAALRLLALPASAKPKRWTPPQEAVSATQAAESTATAPTKTPPVAHRPKPRPASRSGLAKSEWSRKL